MDFGSGVVEQRSSGVAPNDSHCCSTPLLLYSAIAFGSRRAGPIVIACDGDLARRLVELDDTLMSLVREKNRAPARWRSVAIEGDRLAAVEDRRHPHFVRRRREVDDIGIVRFIQILDGSAQRVRGPREADGLSGAGEPRGVPCQS